MGSIIYVTEPEAIDLNVVEQVVGGSDIIVAPGTVTFTGSMDRAYDTLLIRSATHIDKKIKQYFPYLQNVVRVGVGLDNVDLEYCKNEGISVFNAPGANADAASEYVVAMILYSLRRLDRLNIKRIKSWDRFAFRGSSIREHTIGIVGFGHIGKLLYEKLNAFSAPKFLVYDPYISPDDIQVNNIQLTSLDDLLRQATVISLHLPLTPETHYLINNKRLSLIQEGSILINASRGGIVEEAAIVACIDKVNFTYIADTVEGEPAVNEQLLKHENIIITPHIGSLSTFAEQEMIRQALSNYLNGIAAKVF